MMDLINRRSLTKSIAEKAIFKIKQDIAQKSPLAEEDKDFDIVHPRSLTNFPDGNRTRAKWKLKKNYIKPLWDVLTPGELPGEADPGIPLIEIVQKRYARTYDEDIRQANPF